MRGIAFVRKLLAVLASGMAISFALPGHADEIEVADARLSNTEDGVVMNADFAFDLNPRLAEIVTNGVPLYFVVEFELTRPRWYWFDEKPVQLSQTYKITYTPLLRQYRLSVGSAYQNFRRFDDVVLALSRVRGWPVADKGALRKEGGYQAAIRMRLDTAQLPKPFQLNAVASRDWNLASDWYRWTVNP